MIKRAIADIVLILTMFLAPWQWTAVLAVIFMILFRNFWEAVLAGLFLDALYSTPEAKIYGRFGFFTAIVLALFFLLKAAKRKIRWFA